MQVLATLHGHYANMLALDGEDVMSERDAAGVLGAAPFVAKKALEQSRRLGSAKIAAAIKLIAAADLDVSRRQRARARARHRDPRGPPGPPDPSGAGLPARAERRARFAAEGDSIADVSNSAGRMETLHPAVAVTNGDKPGRFDVLLSFGREEGWSDHRIVLRSIRRTPVLSVVLPGRRRPPKDACIAPRASWRQMLCLNPSAPSFASRTQNAWRWVDRQTPRQP